MDRLIFTALSGMNASMTRERVIASNMANAQTIGFRAETIEASPVTLVGPPGTGAGSPLEARAMTRAAVGGASMKAGAMTQTGNGLDVALQGDAMLTVQTPDGGEGYTRRGDLSVAPSGLLQNGDGLIVLGEGGPITVPQNATITIAPDGSVMAGDPAKPDAPPAVVDKLKLASFSGSRMEKGLDGLFRAEGGGVLPADPDARLVAGALEGSNVDPTRVLVEMVEAQRLFDIRSKTIATARDLDEAGASLMRMSA
jgi:flagellar basal-body rod protein FlgF